MNYNKKAKELFEILIKNKKNIRSIASDISQGESGVLLYLLYKNNHVCQSELSENLKISMPRVATIINTLQEKKLILKKTDLNDKRKTIILITDKGKNKITQQENHAISFIENVIKKLDDKEIEQYISISKKIEQISNNLENNTSI